MAGRRNRRTIPAGAARRCRSPFRFRGTDRQSPRAARSLHVVEPCGDVRRRRTGPARRGRFGHRLHLESLCPGAPPLRRGPRRGLRHEPRFRTARGHASRHHPALRRDGREHRHHGQAPRTEHTLYIHRRLRRRVAAGQSRMARCRRGALRPAPGRRRHAAADRPGLRSPAVAARTGRQTSEGDAEHPLPRHVVHAVVAQLHDPPYRGRRRGIRLYREHVGRFGGGRSGRGLPAGQCLGHLDQRRRLQHPRRADRSKPQVRRHPRRPQPPGLQQQRPPDSGRGFRLLGIGRRAPRCRVARPAHDPLRRQRADSNSR